jgi:hypothetical protein
MATARLGWGSEQARLHAVQSQAAKAGEADKIPPSATTQASFFACLRRARMPCSITLAARPRSLALSASLFSVVSSVAWWVLAARHGVGAVADSRSRHGGWVSTDFTICHIARPPTPSEGRSVQRDPVPHAEAVVSAHGRSTCNGVEGAVDERLGTCAPALPEEYTSDGKTPGVKMPKFKH